MSLTKITYSMIDGAAVNIRDCGAVGDGVNNDSPALAAALIKVQSTGQPIYIPAGTYRFESVVSTTGHLNIIGDGDATVLDFSSITAGASAISVTGSYTQIQNVSSANASNLSITFASAPSLNVGDVFFLYDSSVLWNSIRAYYYAGEWCECRGVSGSVAQLTSPLYDGYTSATVKAYKLNSPTVSFRNFKIKGGANLFCLIKMSLIDRPLIENVTAYTENYQAIEIDRCYRVTVIAPNIYNKGTGTLDDYGLIIGNSQKVRVIGGDMYSRRHGITIGGGDYVGAVTNRNIRIIGATISNDITSGVYSADMHGNMQDCIYQDCTIYQGGGWAGMDNGYNNCKIYAASGGMAIYASEVKGGDLFLRNCDIYTASDPSTISRGIVDVGGNSSALTSSTNQTLSLIVENCFIKATGLSSGTDFMKVVNSGSSVNVNMYIDGLRGDVNAMGAVLRTKVDIGTAYSEAIVVDNISHFPSGTYLHLPEGAAYTNKPQRMMRQSGTVSMTATSGTLSTINAGITYKYPYPRTPAAVSTVGGETNGFSNGSGQNIGAANYAVAADKIRPALVSTSNSNWSATQAVTLNWSVGIEEI